ncbi:MAG: hypothetical protein Q9O74_08870 [Planctomycetota bacterium]|nr:hypothetical protein [Planctomycetota bacterium]
MIVRSSRPPSTKRRYGVLAIVLVILGGGVCMGLLGGAVLGYLASPYSPLRWMGESWSEKDLAETRRRGNRLLTAIEAYSVREGQRPASLDDLVPDDVTQIEPPLVGDQQWEYGQLGQRVGVYYLLVDSQYADQSEYFGPQFFRYTSIDGKWVFFEDESF